ncbi:MAG: hypothetical protein COA32_10230 [Fluviicola sp.]|nr:MAG: hypothetical protein COA32_10230 [Fluviicola sp.]
MKTNELTYENWIEGKFELNSVYRKPDESQKDLPYKASPKSILEDELKKINLEQSKLFDTLVNVKETSSKLIDDFNKRFTESKFPESTLKIESNRIIAYLRGKRYNYSKEEVLIEKIGESLPKSYDLNHHNYINRRMKGFPKVFSFVPSPNSKYFNHKHYILPEVYGESLINLYEHISKFDNSIDPLRLFTDPYRSLFKDEPHNDFPDVFSSGYAYSLFIDLEEALIIPSETPKPGDYGLIYKMLVHDTAGAIKNDISLEKFYKFLNRVRDYKLNPTSRKPSFLELKLNIVSFFLREYFRQTRTINKDEIDQLVKHVIEQKAT